MAAKNDVFKRGEDNCINVSIIAPSMSAGQNVTGDPNTSFDAFCEANVGGFDEFSRPSGPNVVGVNCNSSLDVVRKFSTGGFMMIPLWIYF